MNQTEVNREDEPFYIKLFVYGAPEYQYCSNVISLEHADLLCPQGGSISSPTHETTRAYANRGDLTSVLAPTVPQKVLVAGDSVVVNCVFIKKQWARIADVSVELRMRISGKGSSQSSQLGAQPGGDKILVPRGQIREPRSDVPNIVRHVTKVPGVDAGTVMFIGVIDYTFLNNNPLAITPQQGQLSQGIAIGSAPTTASLSIVDRRVVAQEFTVCLPFTPSILGDGQLLGVSINADRKSTSGSSSPVLSNSTGMNDRQLFSKTSSGTYVHTPTRTLSRLCLRSITLQPGLNKTAELPTKPTNNNSLLSKTIQRIEEKRGKTRDKALDSVMTMIPPLYLSIGESIVCPLKDQCGSQPTTQPIRPQDITVEHYPRMGFESQK